MKKALILSTIIALNIFIFNQLAFVNVPPGPLFGENTTVLVTTTTSAEKIVVVDESILTPLVCVDGGSFKMGASDVGWLEHDVSVNPFCIETHEVTNEQYAAFLNQAGNMLEGGSPFADLTNPFSGIELKNNIYTAKTDMGTFPAVAVTWYGAKAYAKWAKRRLPTEAEWEFAAGGKDHTAYSLGNLFVPQFYAFDTLSPLKVASFRPNSFGIYDMSGNVYEWTSTVYRSYPYSATDGREDEFQNYFVNRVTRGGSWINYYQSEVLLRVQLRNYTTPNEAFKDIGFRCAVSNSNQSNPK